MSGDRQSTDRRDLREPRVNLATRAAFFTTSDANVFRPFRTVTGSKQHGCNADRELW